MVGVEGGAGSAAAGLITADVRAGYDAWAQQIGNADSRNPSADADGDGAANLL